MTQYEFECPYCGSKTATILERTQVLRDTELIGFYKTSSGPCPALSHFDDIYDLNGTTVYVCSSCEARLTTDYEGLFDYIKENGRILHETEN
jgi:DNA-directed RNA polymerase subunit RPC12/RpoP